MSLQVSKGHTHTEDKAHACRAATPDTPASETVKDPVCGMNVNPAKTEHHAEHKGVEYHFCSSRCREQFAGDPEKFLVPVPEATESTAPEGTLFTCPMHPEIRRNRPGSCPKCGMALEPVLPTLDEGENPELTDFRRRFWWTLPLTVITVVLAMWGHRFGWMQMSAQSWVELVLATPVVLWAGGPFFVRGWQSMVNRSPNMWTLISLGTGAAYVYSVVATVSPGIFPQSFVAMGRVGVYFEAAAVILSLTLLGQVLELKARSQTSAAIKSLLQLAPRTARRIAPTASRRTYRWHRFTLVTRFGSDPERRSPWMVSFLREAVESMNPC